MTAPAEVRDTWREARSGARSDGLVPALTLLSRALSPGATPRGPGGHAIAPRELLDGLDESEEEQALSVLPPGLAALRPGSGHSTDSDRSATPHFGTGLAWLRLGLSERLRETCVAHLASRQVEGSPLLLQQFVKVTLADALIDQLEIEGVLDDLAEAQAGAEAGSAPEIARLQAQITAVDRALLRLLGAHGFTADGPGAEAYASELLAGVYGGEHDDEECPRGNV
ncbi:acyl-CoA dehydrogenase family protein [Kitasatospora sp. NPDC051170]|uniref:acyl-CoA dehydrogenase family protein n=1 Tax=Kitasatospora sp. NPDC051170 TaxID=3364056 RepID=UPI00378C360B